MKKETRTLAKISGCGGEIRIVWESNAEDPYKVVLKTFEPGHGYHYKTIFRETFYMECLNRVCKAVAHGEF